MNIVFAGTPEFAVPCLKAIVDSRHKVTAVYTQPDRPAGRGRKLKPSPVKATAVELGLEVRQPDSLKHEHKALADQKPDAMIVVAYGLILPKTILEIPKQGCINVHASLLPRWRGAAPIQRAIQEGDKETGVSIMQMEAGLDTGPVWLKESITIKDEDTAQSLHDRLAQLGAKALLEGLALVEKQLFTPEIQEQLKATYARKLNKDEVLLDWSQAARVLHRKIRAFNPWPVASCRLQGQTIRIWGVGKLISKEIQTDIKPGEIIEINETGLAISTGDGELTITELQAQNSKRMSARDFANGLHLKAGDCFE